jgi:hypothetical protein
LSNLSGGGFLFGVNMKRGFTGLWIPAQIWERKDLQLIDKALFGEIHALDAGNEWQGCFASNAYLAEFFQVTNRTIQRHLIKLKELGLIYQSSFNGKKRFLKVGVKSMTPQTRQLRHPRGDKSVTHITKDYNKNKEEDFIKTDAETRRIMRELETERAK